MTDKKSPHKGIDDWKAVTAYASVHEDAPTLIQPTELNRNKTQAQVLASNQTIDEDLQCFAEEQVAENVQHQVVELKKPTTKARQQTAKEAQIIESDALVASVVKNRVLVMNHANESQTIDGTSSDHGSLVEGIAKLHCGLENGTDDGKRIISMDDESAFAGPLPNAGV